MKTRFALLLIFFLSGISALIYQVVWLKYLGLIFGNTVYAAATLIAVYLAGLGIGGALFGRRARNWDPLVVYAILEALIGLLGALSPNAFVLLDDAYIRLFRSVADAPLLLATGRAVVVALFLLPPTILMGGTLPVLVRASPRPTARRSRRCMPRTRSAPRRASRCRASTPSPVRPADHDLIRRPPQLRPGPDRRRLPVEPPPGRQRGAAGARGNSTERDPHLPPLRSGRLPPHGPDLHRR